MQDVQATNVPVIIGTLRSIHLKCYIEKIRIIWPSILSLQKSTLLGAINILLCLRSYDLMENTHKARSSLKNKKTSERKVIIICSKNRHKCIGTMVDRGQFEIWIFDFIRKKKCQKIKANSQAKILSDFSTTALLKSIRILRRVLENLVYFLSNYSVLWSHRSNQARYRQVHSHSGSHKRLKNSMSKIVR